MEKQNHWDWDTKLKQIPVKEWENLFNWVEEPVISPDGEQVACIVNKDEMAFGICVNGKLWEGEYEKAWSLRALPGNRFAACVCQDEEWTLAVDEKEWTNRFDFIWDLRFSEDGSVIGLAFQQDMAYGMVVNDLPWEEQYENISAMTLGRKKGSAAIVQVDSMAAADLAAFKKGLFSVAVNGKALDSRFMNIWDLALDSKGESCACGVRLDRESYTVARNGIAWDGRFQSVWKPVFDSRVKSVLAPVKIKGRWQVFKDDAPFWKTRYENLWHLTPCPGKEGLAAIAAPQFGRWTVVENDEAWPVCWDTMVRNIYYSDNGAALVAVFKHRGYWGIAVNGMVWDLACDKIFTPILSPEGSMVAVTFEKQGRNFVAANNKIVTTGFDYLSDPVINPDKGKLLVKGIENGVYKRLVLNLGDQGFKPCLNL